MSLLQWVKNGLGLGPKRTSETIPLSPETFGTRKGVPETLVLVEPKDGYAALVAAKKKHEEASLLAMQELLRDLDAAGYNLNQFDGGGWYTAHEKGTKRVLTEIKSWNSRITVSAKDSSSPASIVL